MSIETVKYLSEAVFASNARSFESLSFMVGGLTLTGLTMLMLIAFCFGTAVGYLKAVAGIISKLYAALYSFQYQLHHGATANTTHLAMDAVLGEATMSSASNSISLILIVLFCLMPLSVKDNLSDLRLASLMGFMSICIMTFCIALNFMSLGIHESLVKLDGSPNWHAILFGDEDANYIQAVGLLMFSYNCHANVPSIFKELEQRSTKRMQKISQTGLGLCMMIYLTAGIFGYLTFGSATLGNILENAPTGENLVVLVCNLIALCTVGIAVVFAYPMNIFPIVYSIKASYFVMKGRDLVEFENDESCMLEGLSEPSSDPNRTESPGGFMLGGGYAILTVSLTLIVALWVTSIEQVFTLVGAVTGSAVALILPAIYFMRLCRLTKTKAAVAFSVGVSGMLLAGLGLYTSFME